MKLLQLGPVLCLHLLDHLLDEVHDDGELRHSQAILDAQWDEEG